jgi:hypothetical protein
LIGAKTGTGHLEDEGMVNEPVDGGGCRHGIEEVFILPP